MTETLRYVLLAATAFALCFVVFIWAIPKRDNKQCGTMNHKWNRDFRKINLSATVFMRVDCVKCGAAIDGTKAKRVYDATGMTFGEFVDP